MEWGVGPVCVNETLAWRACPRGSRREHARLGRGQETKEIVGGREALVENCARIMYQTVTDLTP